MSLCVLLAIPFKNKSDITISCLESLSRSYVSGLTYEILLISDGSEDKEIDLILKNNPYGNNIPIVKQSNIGYTTTAFSVVEYAKKRGFDFLLLSNNDIKFLPSTLYSLTSRMKLNKNIASVGCKVLHWTDDIIIHTGTRINKKCENWIENPYCGLSLEDPITNVPERRLWVNGCCALYNLEIMRKENMNFDLNFTPAYFEESDLMTRFNMKGYSVIYEPQAVVRHMVNASHREDSNCPIYFNRNWELYLSKWKKYFSSRMLYFQEEI